MSATPLRPPPGAFDDEDEQQPLIPAAPPSAKHLEIAESVTRLIAERSSRSSTPRASRKSQERAKAQMEQMAESGDWSEATGAHLVALFDWLHSQVYGVQTSELDPKTWAIAVQVAGRLVEREFEDDYGKAVCFMRWAWRREQESERWRRENGRTGRRVGWRLQFSGTLVTDYKVDCARRAK